MDSRLSLKWRLTEFLLASCITPHATTEMRPDELFYTGDYEPASCYIVQPNLFSVVDKHQVKQKSAHDNSKPLISFTKGKTVLIHDQRLHAKGNNRKDPTAKRTSELLSKSGLKDMILPCGSFV